ncbi:hypothetical protein ASF62_06210 [Leifsonia sp. Leaf325]|nr:hypothetical protein [Leifsonia sp. Leaf325]KQQ93787.1 hypothetical protein ASF62_06210 [Leifsonia sp. Leaf325]
MSTSRRAILTGAVVSGLVLAASLAGAAPAATAATTGTLSLYKAIENLDTGSSEGDRSLWDVRAVNLDTGEVIQAQGLNGFQSQPLPAGPYEISEVVRADSPSGYEFRDWACNGNVTTDPVRSIYLDTGQNLTCTVTNVAVKPTITLQKIVQGGSASPSLWTVTAEGPNSISGAGQASGEVRIGRYHLTETGGPSGSGYVAGPWICTQTSPAGETSDLPVEAGDFIDVELGVAVSCSITNSADLPQLTLVKSVAPAAFPVDPPTSWTLSAQGTGGTPGGFSGASGSLDVSHVTVDAGSYELGETGPGGYDQQGWTCVDAAGAAVAVADTTVTLGPIDDVRCTVTNAFTGGWLTLVKQVIGEQPASAWELSATGPRTITGATGSPQVTRAPVPVGDYVLAESGPTEGYVTSGYTCTGSSDPVATVSIAAGDDITCTIVNDSETAHLSLVKSVGNAGGGTLGPADWTLAADGPESFSGAGGSADVSFIAVVPGTYALSESSSSPDADSYLAGDWVCVDDVTDAEVSTGQTVTIGDEQSVTCTVTNTWQNSTLTLRKQVLVPFGANPGPGGFTLIATSPGLDTISGVTGDASATRVSVPGGSSWTLDEDGPAGFDLVGWGCAPGSGDVTGPFTVPPGTDVICTAENVSITPTLTLRKVLVDRAGGTAAVDDFTLQARGPGNAALSGPDGSPEVTNFLIPPGDYVFRELGPAGYNSTWSCTGTDQPFDGTTLALGFGENAICTATNRAIAPTLALGKTVTGGSAAPGDWTVAASGPSDLTGPAPVAATEVSVGVYELSEAPATGSEDIAADYVPGTWSCSGAGFDPADLVSTGPGTATLTLNLADAVSCAVENTYDPPVLTLVKLVDDGADGPGSTPSNWVLTATGETAGALGTSISGPGGDAAITAQPVPSGRYSLEEAVNIASPPLSVDYAATAWSCTGEGFDASDLASDDGSTQLTLRASSDVTCSIENVFDPPRLTLVKQVVGGGPLTAADWQLTWTEVDDPSRTGTGATGAPAVTGAPVQDGTFELSEASASDSAADYTASDWECSGGESDGGDRITLVAADVAVTCTITNTFAGAPVPTDSPTPTPTTTADPSDGGGGSGAGAGGDAPSGSMASTGFWGGPLITVGALLLVAGITLLLGAGGLRRRSAGEEGR